jgi:hypothetical protein
VNARIGNKAREFREDYPGGKLRQGTNGEIAVS